MDGTRTPAGSSERTPLLVKSSELLEDQNMDNDQEAQAIREARPTRWARFKQKFQSKPPVPVDTNPPLTKRERRRHEILLCDKYIRQYRPLHTLVFLGHKDALSRDEQVWFDHFQWQRIDIREFEHLHDKDLKHNGFRTKAVIEETETAKTKDYFRSVAAMLAINVLCYFVAVPMLLAEENLRRDLLAAINAFSFSMLLGLWVDLLTRECFGETWRQPMGTFISFITFLCMGSIPGFFVA